MGGKQMEGDDRERREAAKEAREQGKRPSEERSTLGASQQREAKPENASHADRVADD